MKISTAINNLSKKFDISPKEMALCELVLSGWNSKDGYILLFSPAGNAPLAYVNEQIKRIIERPQFQAYFEYKQQELQKQDEKNIEYDPNIELLEKEHVLKELLGIANSMPPGSKEKADVLMKYATLQQMQKDEVSEEDTTVHYYLPLSCNNCEMYIQKQKTNHENRTD